MGLGRGATLVVPAFAGSVVEGLRPTAELHGGGRAEVGAGRHAGEMARVEDVGAGARRPRAAGAYIGDDR